MYLLKPTIIVINSLRLKPNTSVKITFEIQKQKIVSYYEFKYYLIISLGGNNFEVAKLAFCFYFILRR